MSKNFIVVTYVVLLIAVIVAVDVLFFRHQFGRRLIANVLIVVAFAVVYALLLRRS